MQRTLSLLLALWIISFVTQAQDVRSQLRQIANDLAKQIEAKGKKRVVIASFLNLKNQETELGRYMSDKFSIGMSSANSTLEITDRSQLAQLLLDNKLAAERILDPKTIPRLGNITGAEVIITGNYTALDNSVDITVKAIELEKGLRLAVAEGTIPRTSEINKLLGEVDLLGPGGDPIEPIPTSISCKGKNDAGATITVRECVLGGQTITCNLLVTNNRQDKANANFGYSIYQASIITDSRKQYTASSIIIANTGTAGISVAYNAIYGTEVDGKVVFNVEDSTVKKLQLFEMRDQGLKCLNVPVSSSSK